MKNKPSTPTPLDVALQQIRATLKDAETKLDACNAHLAELVAKREKEPQQ